MAGVDLPVTPSRRVVAFTGPVYDAPQPWPLTVDFPSALYFHPEGTGIAIGWTDPDEPDGFDITVRLQQWLERAAPDLQRRAPELLAMPLRTAWAGLYENTPDHNQVIGSSAEVEGFFYATGFSGHGFLMAPATSEVVRDLVMGKEPEFDVTGFSVDRFGSAVLRPEHNII
jgi:sarcosine oxidase subunit beta